MRRKKKKTSPQRNQFGRKITPREALLLAIAEKKRKKEEREKRKESGSSK